MDEILLSIWCNTYNHELYIRDSIESFLMQKTNFRYEIIIHDDASTDMTAGIIREYEKQYPDLIHGIYQTKNQWSQNHPDTEWIRRLQTQNCKGKYVALCEGDDYWIDSRKLQLQVDYLEKHSECMMSIHEAVDVNYENHTIRAKKLYDTKDCLIPPGEIITQNRLQIPTASMVFRHEILEMEKFFLHVGMDDYPYLLYCLSKGNIYYINRIMSVYRFCHEGSWSASMAHDIDGYIIQLILTIDFLEKYNKYSSGKYDWYVISKIQICVDDLINSLGKQTLSSLLEICKKYDEKTEKKYYRIFKRLVRVWKQIHDDKYLDEDTFSFINHHKKIFIMGAGKYAGVIARQLNDHGINFEGFVVSDNQKKENHYLEKNVWKLNEIITDVDNIGIIIGINPTIWDQIKLALKNFDEKDYMCPFLFNGDIEE